MLKWREIKVAKTKIANLPDTLKFVKFLIAEINVFRVLGYEPWHFIVQFRIHHQLLVIFCTF